MRLAYCDDEKIQLEYVRKLAGQWAMERGAALHYDAYQSAKELLFENEQGYPFDLLILDIDMQGMDGMALARKIRETDKKLPILFLTNCREYVFEGYEVAALRYLLKPLDEEKLFALLDEMKYLQEKEKHYIIESIGGEQIKLAVEDIFSVEANGHYLTIHTRERDYELKKGLAEYEAQLNSVNFISTHRSYLVNIAHVERVLRNECVLSDGSSVPVSRNSYKAVNEAFITYNMR